MKEQTLCHSERSEETLGLCFCRL